MFIVRSLTILSFVTALGCAASPEHGDLASVTEAADAPRAAVADYNLQNDLALGGYDPVSYFEGDAPVLGQRKHAARVRGVVYFFASDAHRDTFLADPRAYEPAYGGWCAWAMAKGGKTVDADPTNFTIEDGVLRVFYRNALVDTRSKWQAGDIPALQTEAANQWADRSGEPLEHLALR
ncbi:MAG: YHS domain-containing (seleno)protein [Myxococcota bacterium]